jgi:hypothetical protein
MKGYIYFVGGLRVGLSNTSLPTVWHFSMEDELSNASLENGILDNIERTLTAR